ncbi:hypothetical protein OPQ81_005276 [Rhizoctonia solani]|nr:hypothetical protein OPQ81_005276 [Rhizoctonia solani]
MLIALLLKAIGQNWDYQMLHILRILMYGHLFLSNPPGTHQEPRLGRPVEGFWQVCSLLYSYPAGRDHREADLYATRREIGFGHGLKDLQNLAHAFQYVKPGPAAVRSLIGSCEMIRCPGCIMRGLLIALTNGRFGRSVVL